MYDGIKKGFVALANAVGVVLIVLISLGQIAFSLIIGIVSLWFVWSLGKPFSIGKSPLWCTVVEALSFIAGVSKAWVFGKGDWGRGLGVFLPLFDTEDFTECVDLADLVVLVFIVFIDFVMIESPSSLWFSRSSNISSSNSSFRDFRIMSSDSLCIVCSLLLPGFFFFLVITCFRISLAEDTEPRLSGLLN